MEQIKHMTVNEHRAAHDLPPIREPKYTRKRKNHSYAPWCIIGAIFLCGAIIGGIITAAVKPSAATDNLPSPLYGTRDGKVIEGEPLAKYEAGSGFVPLECALSEELQEFTFYLCKAYYIDFDFAMAIMFTESSFRPSVVSGTNDYGLMQINEINHEWLSEELGITDFSEPYQNIRAGLYILRKLFEKYDEPAAQRGAVTNE